MDLQNVLNNLDASLRGDYYILRCPVCGKKEAFLYVEDLKKYQKNPQHKILIYCNRKNKCGETTVLNTMFDKPLKIKEIPKEEKVVQITPNGIKFVQQFVNYYLNSLHCEVKEFDFDIRGISNKTLKENGIIYYPKKFEQMVEVPNLKAEFSDKYRANSYKNRNIFIPILNYNGEAERLLLRSTNNDVHKKEIQLMLKPRGFEIWNIKDLISSNSKFVVVTEGVYDALSFKEIKPNLGVISLPGVGKYKQLVKEIKKNLDTTKNKIFILATDNDEAGNKYKNLLIEALDELKIQHVNFDLRNHKDANEFLQSSRLSFVLSLKKILLPFEEN